MQTPARHFPATAWTACLITAVVLCSSANHARAQDDLVTADPADLLAISQLTIGMDPVEACGDRAIQCSSAGGIPHADGGWEKSCKDSRKIISLASRGKMKPIHKGVCKAKYLVVDADQEGQPTLRYADYAMYDGKECKRWPDAGARTTMTEEEVAIAALEGRLVGASKLRGALFKWYKAQSNPPPFSALPLTAKRKIDPAQWNFGVISPTCGCQCGAWEMVDAVVNNARRGDVALVSITDGKGDGAVGAVMRTLQQNHRHALIFMDRESVRHSTQILQSKDVEPPVWDTMSGLGYPIPRDWEPGDPRHCTWQSEESKWGTLAETGTPRWPTSYWPTSPESLIEDVDGKPLTSDKRIRPEFLRNGLPGIISQTVTEATACQRLGTVGLLLTHGADQSGEARATFERAAEIAGSESGYYKVSEYSGLEQWQLNPIQEDSAPLREVELEFLPGTFVATETIDYLNENLRGTTCSGFVQGVINQAMTEAERNGRITNFEYGAGLRQDVAEQLYALTYSNIYAKVWDQAQNPDWSIYNLGQGLIVRLCPLISCKKSTAKKLAKKLANQTVNCFSGADGGGCDITDEDLWKNPGEGATVSPDNLLPTSFMLKTAGGTGSTGWCTSWDDYSEPQDFYISGYPKPIGQIPYTRVSLCPGDTVNSDIGHEAGQDTANFPSPFKRVEPLVLAGSTWTYADVPMLGDWAQTLPGAP